MPTGRDDVRFRWETGSHGQTVKMTRMTHVGHKDRAKGSLSGQFQVNSYPCSTMKRYSSARSMCSRWTATIIWMRFRASAPYRTDRVGRTRSAVNGEGALLPKLLIF